MTTDSSTESADKQIETTQAKSLARDVGLRDPDSIALHLLHKIREAIRKPEGTTREHTLDRTARVTAVLRRIPRARREYAYQWGDAQFQAAVEVFPTRLPIKEHEKRVRALRWQWVWPLRFLGGVARFVARKKSKEPEDAHWRRFAQLVNRVTKSKSKARKKWLHANRRSPAQLAAEQRYREKRKAAQEGGDQP